ncbi:MAG: hypothetical protein D6828_01960 [Nitrospirae bacterium]|nr:MAG: hypothetical protein D6828_01960 [Nitrospirota bacterium]
MKRELIIVMFTIIIGAITTSYAGAIPFTQEDRDRLRNIELKVERLEAGQKAINQRIEDVNKRIGDVNKRIDDVNKKIEDVNKKIEDTRISLQKEIEGTNRRIDDLRDLIYVVLGGMIALIGFVIWDRRTALAPAIKKNKELEEREERIERALRELAKKDPKVAEVLKHEGLL